MQEIHSYLRQGPHRIYNPIVRIGIEKHSVPETKLKKNVELSFSSGWDFINHFIQLRKMKP